MPLSKPHPTHYPILLALPSVKSQNLAITLPPLEAACFKHVIFSHPYQCLLIGSLTSPLALLGSIFQPVAGVIILNIKSCQASAQKFLLAFHLTWKKTKTKHQNSDSLQAPCDLDTCDLDSSQTPRTHLLPFLPLPNSIACSLLQPHWPPCSSLNMPSKSRPQDLCTCHSLCWDIFIQISAWFSPSLLWDHCSNGTFLESSALTFPLSCIYG